jgi:hypothetical protein
VGGNLYSFFGYFTQTIPYTQLGVHKNLGKGEKGRVICNNRDSMVEGKRVVCIRDGIGSGDVDILE